MEFNCSLDRTGEMCLLKDNWYKKTLNMPLQPLYCCLKFISYAGSFRKGGALCKTFHAATKFTMQKENQVLCIVSHIWFREVFQHLGLCKCTIRLCKWDLHLESKHTRKRWSLGCSRTIVQRSLVHRLWTKRPCTTHNKTWQHRGRKTKTLQGSEREED